MSDTNDNMIARGDSGAATRTAPTPFVLGGRLSWSPHGALAVAAVCVFSMLPVRGLYRATGSSMEEGFMLVFGRLVQQGRVPNVDFLHLYGPGSLDALAGWYWIFGYTLESQRTFGLLQNLAIIFAMYALTRAWGRFAAVGCAGITALIIMTPIGLSALAWHGAIALSLWAIAFAIRARYTERTGDMWAAGLLAGLALSFRPDVVLAVAAALCFVTWTNRRNSAKPILLGAAIGLVPMWIHLAVAGIGPAVDGMVLDPVFRLRAGRELPRPPSLDEVDGALQAVAEGAPPWWGLPAPAAKFQLFFWFFAVIIIAIGVPLASWLQRRRGDTSSLNTVLVTVGIFGVGILPQALQRPDSTHLAWVAVVSWPLLAALIANRLTHIAYLAHVARQRSWIPSLPSAVGVGAVALAMLVICPFYTYRHYVLHTRVAAGDLPLPFLVERDDRRFWFGDPFVASALTQMSVDLAAVSQPGDRLIVGPADLSRTIYSDVAVYFQFPELEPATYFIEMDPGLADAEGSGLAADIVTADYLVLTNIWTGWNEPNASSDFQSQEHNHAVADNFCLIDHYEENLVMLFERCPGGGGSSGADIAGRYPLPADST